MSEDYPARPAKSLMPQALSKSVDDQWVVHKSVVSGLTGERPNQPGSRVSVGRGELTGNHP
jgi:hypothetical protein